MITEKDVIYVADLANLELTSDERVRFVKDLSSILEYIDRLNELDTANIPPMAQIADRYAATQDGRGNKFAYAQRADTPQPCLPHEAALRNAPDSDRSFFKVPRVIEK